MIKSKHFRKDVIIARIVFLCFCALLIAGVVWLVSFLRGSAGPGEEKESGSQIETNSDSEEETYSSQDSETESEIESGTEPETETLPVEKLYVKVTAKNLNLRKEPNTNCEVITSLKKGTKVELVEELDGWFKVIYEGQEGYLSSDYATIIAE